MAKERTPQQQAKFLQQQQRRAQNDAWLRAHPKARLAIYAFSTVLVLAILGICGSAAWAGFQGGANALQSTPTADTNQQAVLSNQSTTTPTVHPTQRPTQIITPKPTVRPTQQPTHQATPRPTQPPQPTPTHPSCQGVNGNPWCYDFNSPGNYITNPPSSFCTYFNCISSFWQSTNGYVDECVDGTYSHSGGRQGDCSHHGGQLRPLYSH